jgi:hypothetical protein
MNKFHPTKHYFTINEFIAQITEQINNDPELGDSLLFIDIPGSEDEAATLVTDYSIDEYHEGSTKAGRVMAGSAITFYTGD